MWEILIGTAGALTRGSPYLSLPIVAVLVRTDVGAGALITYMTGWSLITVVRLLMEVGILGWQLTVVRLISTCFFPPIARIIAHRFFSRWIKK